MSWDLINEEGNNRMRRGRRINKEDMWGITLLTCHGKTTSTKQLWAGSASMSKRCWKTLTSDRAGAYNFRAGYKCLVKAGRAADGQESAPERRPWGRKLNPSTQCQRIAEKRSLELYNIKAITLMLIMSKWKLGLSVLHNLQTAQWIFLIKSLILRYN